MDSDSASKNAKIESMRDLGRWNRPVYEHASIEAFLASQQLADGIHAIAYGGAYPEINLHRRRRSKALLILFSAALSSRTNAFRLPVFSGTQGVKATKANVVMVSDPVLYLDDGIRLAWYAGAANMPLQQDLPKVLRHVQDVLAIERTVLYGASGGGYAALFYAPLVRDAIAVACNPQVDLYGYSPVLVSKYLAAAFGYRGKLPDFQDAEIAGKPVMRLQAEHLHKTRILYLQNALDERHMKRDFLPLLRTLGVERGDALVEVHSEHLITLCADGWGAGHRAAPATFVYAVLRILSAPGGWSQLPARLPELYASTATPFQEVTLSIDEAGFIANATLIESKKGELLRLTLIDDSEALETVESLDGIPARFERLPAPGWYTVVAELVPGAERSSRSWRERMADLFGKGRKPETMRSRPVVVEG